MSISKDTTLEQASRVAERYVNSEIDRVNAALITSQSIIDAALGSGDKVKANIFTSIQKIINRQREELLKWL